VSKAQIWNRSSCLSLGAGAGAEGCLHASGIRCSQHSQAARVCAVGHRSTLDRPHELVSRGVARHPPADGWGSGCEDERGHRRAGGIRTAGIWSQTGLCCALQAGARARLEWEGRVLLSVRPSGPLRDPTRSETAAGGVQTADGHRVEKGPRRLWEAHARRISLAVCPRHAPQAPLARPPTAGEAEACSFCQTSPLGPTRVGIVRLDYTNRSPMGQSSHALATPEPPSKAGHDHQKRAGVPYRGHEAGVVVHIDPGRRQTGPLAHP